METPLAPALYLGPEAVVAAQNQGVHSLQSRPDEILKAGDLARWQLPEPSDMAIVIGGNLIKNNSALVGPLYLAQGADGEAYSLDSIEEVALETLGDKHVFAFNPPQQWNEASLARELFKVLYRRPSLFGSLALHSGTTLLGGFAGSAFNRLANLAMDTKSAITIGGLTVGTTAATIKLVRDYTDFKRRTAKAARMPLFSVAYRPFDPNTIKRYPLPKNEL